MSEIKGQLIGMLIVISIAAVIGTMLVGAFKTNVTNITNSMGSESLYELVNVIKARFMCLR